MMTFTISGQAFKAAKRTARSCGSCLAESDTLVPKRLERGTLVNIACDTNAKVCVQRSLAEPVETFVCPDCA